VSDTRIEEAIRGAAIDILNREGARQFYLGGVFTIGLWRAADTPEVRAAITALHPGGVQVVHLEDARVPPPYREHKPLHVKTAAEWTPAEARGVAWAEWKAGVLNRLSEQHGATGQPGRITAATVRDGEGKVDGSE
jgi:hypothetical protein